MRGGEQSDPEHGGPGGGVRHRQRPGPVHQQHEWQQQRGGGADLPGCGGERRHAHAPEPASEDAGEGVGQRPGQAGELCRDARAQAAQGVWSDHEHGAREAHGDAGQLETRQLLVGREQVRDQDGEQRGGGVQDRGEAAGDMVLPPDDQDEGHHVVEQPHAEERGPDPALWASVARIGAAPTTASPPRRPRAARPG